MIVWAAACHLNFDAASSYYGGGIVDLINETPKCQTIMHFGREDDTIPLEDVNIISKAHPNVTIHLYDAGHGFNCDRRGSYDEKSAELALTRTLELFAGAIS